MRSSGTSAEHTVCEYAATNRSEIQAFEANVKVLQNRIRELEVAQETDDAAVRLHQPYSTLIPTIPSSEVAAPTRKCMICIENDNLLELTVHRRLLSLVVSQQVRESL